MSVLTELPDAPEEVDGNELIYVRHPTAEQPNRKSTVARIATWILGQLPFDVASPAPTWSASTTQPALGSGTLAATVSDNGPMRTVNLRLTFSVSTTPGAGSWSFAVPGNATSNAVGIARAKDASTGNLAIGICEIVASSNLISIASNEGAWGAALPFAWTSGDSLDLSITYRIEP